MKRPAAVLSLLLVCAAPVRAEIDATMAAAANRFYASYAALPRTGGIPDAAGRARLRPLLSARLGTQIDAAAAAQARFQARNKDSPPLIEGDLFSSQFEGFTSYRVGACSGTAAAGRCTVQLHYQPPAPGRGAAGQTNNQPVDWTDELLLVKAQGAWKVDDVAYKGAFAFGNAGLLSQTLKMVISTAP